MSKAAIEIHNLSKRYTIRRHGRKEVFTALDQVNLKVEKGTVMGLIGHNGAGKSTLLKILSRISYPSSGEAILRGRLSSLLEVGTGFHAELSGRENIFLNGSILGMSRSEIRSKLDEIIEFAGVEQFIDTPVKHYSSGMYVRLAFSVAANLTPDILLIDEVLAVGDAAFQEKCLRKVEQSKTEEGRTIIFVSHNMSAIRKLCDQVAWLDHGRIKMLGEAEEVITAYLKDLEEIAIQKKLNERHDRKGSGEAIITDLDWEGSDGLLISGKPARLLLKYQAPELHSLPSVNLRLNVYKNNGEFLTTLSNDAQGQSLNALPQQGEIECRFEALPFSAGDYFITSNLFVNRVKADKVERALNFSVKEGDHDRAGAIMYKRREGVLVPQQWQLSPKD